MTQQSSNLNAHLEMRKSTAFENDYDRTAQEKRVTGDPVYCTINDSEESFPRLSTNTEVRDPENASHPGESVMHQSRYESVEVTGKEKAEDFMCQHDSFPGAHDDQHGDGYKGTLRPPLAADGLYTSIVLSRPARTSAKSRLNGKLAKSADCPDSRRDNLATATVESGADPTGINTTSQDETDLPEDPIELHQRECELAASASKNYSSIHIIVNRTGDLYEEVDRMSVKKEDEPGTQAQFVDNEIYGSGHIEK